MFTQILIPLDFSPSSDAALALARERFPGDSPLHAGEAVETAEAAMYERLKGLARPGDETAVLVGDPAERILWATDHWKPQLVLMGTHGRTGLAHLLVGSVAESVVRKAHVPVLVTKDLKGT